MTFKEFMRRPNPKLDALAEEAERQRTLDEEYSYDKRLEGCDEEPEEWLTTTYLVRVCADYKYTHTISGAMKATQQRVRVAKALRLSM